MYNYSKSFFIFFPALTKIIPVVKMVITIAKLCHHFIMLIVPMKVTIAIMMSITPVTTTPLVKFPPS